MDLEPEELEHLVGKLPSDSRFKHRFLVIFDGACVFCKFSVDFLRKVDFLKQYSYITLQEFSRIEGVKIPYSLLQESIHVIDRNRSRVWSSTKAIFILLLRSPPSFPLLILLGFLRVIRIAEPAYRWLAQSREAISAMLTR